MQKCEHYTKFSYINEKQLQIYCCALALGMTNVNPKEMSDFSTVITSKQILQKNLIFLNYPEVRTLATSLLKAIENLQESESKFNNKRIVDFTDFYLLEKYLSKFRYFYLAYHCQKTLDDNKNINLMNDNPSDINFVAFMTLNLFAETN
jgi:hypothetical protein